MVIFSLATPPPFPTRRNPEARNKVTRSEVRPLQLGPVINGSEIVRRIAGFLQKLASGRFGLRFVRAARLVPDNPGGKLNRARMDRNAVLLHQENFPVCRHGQNEGGTGGVNPIHVFPMAFFDQCQELA